MEHKPERHKHERFLSANQELCGFLRQVDCIADGICMISDGDLQIMSERLFVGAPCIGDASRGEILDGDLRNGIAEYVSNFRALQTNLARLRSIMRTRRMQMETVKDCFDRFRGYASLYQHETL